MHMPFGEATVPLQMLPSGARVPTLTLLRSVLSLTSALLKPHKRASCDSSMIWTSCSSSQAGLCCWLPMLRNCRSIAPASMDATAVKFVPRCGSWAPPRHLCAVALSQSLALPQG